MTSGQSFFAEMVRHKMRQEDLAPEVERLKETIRRARNGLGGLRRRFEEEHNAIGLAMIEMLCLDLDEALNPPSDNCDTEKE